MTEMESLRLPAPAKLNLMLRIVGRREDGYHLLQTVFRFIDYCDWITLRPTMDGRVRLANPLPGVPEETDLTVRAARALQAATGLTERGVIIEIEKNLPMGGGLGVVGRPAWCVRAQVHRTGARCGCAGLYRGRGRLGRGGR